MADAGTLQTGKSADFIVLEANPLDDITNTRKISDVYLRGMAEIKKFYYDLAGASNRGAVASLLELVKSSQILFGTDFPPGGSAVEYVKALGEMKLLNQNDLRAIDRDNAVRLLPRLGRQS